MCVQPFVAALFHVFVTLSTNTAVHAKKKTLIGFGNRYPQEIKEMRQKTIKLKKKVERRMFKKAEEGNNYRGRD